MPSQPVRVISVSTGTILRTIAILLALGLLWMIRDIVLYVFIAFLLAGVIYPAARWAASHRIPKSLAVILFYLLMFGVLALAFSLLIPAIFAELRQLIGVYVGSGGALPDWATSLKDLSERAGVADNLKSSVEGIQNQLYQIFGGVFGTLTSIFGGISGLVVVLVLSLYIIVEESAVLHLFRSAVPTEYQKLASQVSWQVIDKLGSWMRGQLVLCLIIGIMYFIGLSIIGVPYALLLAIIGGLLEFIPYIGPIVSAIPIVVLALSVSPARAVVALILIVIIQQLENNVIVPKIMQKAVGLNPIVSIVAFLVGAKLFGLVGALFSIPVATAASVAVVEILRFRRERTEV